MKLRFYSGVLQFFFLLNIIVKPRAETFEPPQMFHFYVVTIASSDTISRMLM